MNRLQFMLRDLFWLAIAVALAMGWWLDRSGLAEKNMDLTTQLNAESAESFVKQVELWDAAFKAKR